MKSTEKTIITHMKIIFTLLAVGVVGLTGGLIYQNLTEGDNQNEQTKVSASATPTTTTTSSTVSPSATTGGTTASKGAYVTYNADNFTATAGTRILFFHASWCPQCRQLDSDINKSTLPAGVTIFKVDYDSNQDLRKKYGVTVQTTLVKVDSNGNLLEKFVAYDDPSFSKVQAELL
jgi:thiol-disulfide isomerase/thioredoxin